MRNYFKRIPSSIFAALICAMLTGCGDGASTGDSGGATASPAASANYAVGKITLEDGSPITGDIQDYMINIYGVSEAGEKVSYSPAVTNGTYKQKLVAGQYAFNPSKIKMGFGAASFMLELVPVGSNWNKNRDAADGIVQDFVWKPVGQRETYGAPADPNNATHWHGLSVGMRFATYREDKKAAAVAPPDGSKLTFNLSPKSKGINGQDMKPVVFERDWHANSASASGDLNNFMPGDYEITGVCKFPDGTTTPIVFQGAGDYPNFVETGKVPLQIDALIGGYSKQLFSWGLK